MLAPLEHQKAAQTQQEVRQEQELVRQHEEIVRVEGLLGSVRRDRDDVRKEVQTLSEQLTQTLQRIGELTTDLGQTRQMISPASSIPPPPLPLGIPHTSVVQPGIPSLQMTQPYIPSAILDNF